MNNSAVLQKLLLTFVMVLSSTLLSIAQNVGINANGATPADCSMLDIVSTTKGLLIPRVALTDVTAWAPLTGTAVDGVIVYSTSAPTGGSGTGYYYWSTVVTAHWVNLLDNLNPGTPWLTSGNTGLSSPAAPATYGTSTIGASENWMGHTDAKDIVFGTDTKERMRIMKTTGFVGIGTAAPSTLFHIDGGTGSTSQTIATITGNSLTTGTGLSIASSSAAGTLNTSDYMLNISRSGANAGNNHTAYGIYSSVTNTNATSGSNYGGYFIASGATTTNIGAYGTTSSLISNDAGIRGVSTGATGQVYGVYGSAVSSNTWSAGVYGSTSHKDANAILALNTAAIGTGNGTGIYAEGFQSNGAGIWGVGSDFVASGTGTCGVYGSANNKNVLNAGVYGQNDNNTSGTSWLPTQVTSGVAGRTTGTATYSAGVYGYNNNSTIDNNAALFGQDGQACKAGIVFTYTPGGTQRTMGIYTEMIGQANDRAMEGIWNISDVNAPWGFIGESTTGVYGTSGTVAGAYGVWGNANSTGRAVYGNNAGTGYGGYFTSAGTGLYATTSTPASYYGIYNANGGGYSTGTGAGWTSSDARYKTDIHPIADGILNKIMKLNPCEYYFDADKYPVFRGDEGKHVGLIAQELEKIFPDFVNNKKYIPDPTANPDEGETVPMVKGYYAVDYGSLIPVLIKGMQEQQQLIAKLRSQLDIAIHNYGTSKLINGKARVNFEASFIEQNGNNIPVVTITAMGLSNGIYISEIDSKGFEVSELNNGNSNLTFSYILIGKNSNDVNKIVLPNPLVEQNINASEITIDNSPGSAPRNKISLRKMREQ